MRILLFIIILPLIAFGQNTIGLPEVINYNKQAYSAGLQNWKIAQDHNGIIYVANNEGLLSYDGTYWLLYPLPNRTIVRSVMIGEDNKIYVGGQDELGYFSPAANGRLQYHSLTLALPAKDRSFGDVWDIVAYHKNVFFRSTNKIFQFQNESVAIYNAVFDWSFIGVCHDRLYAHDSKNGLMVFQNQVWNPLSASNNLSNEGPVTSILPINSGNAVITTLKNGLFLLSGNGIEKLNSPNNQLFSNERIYAATTVNTEWIALATTNSGVYIIDELGNIIQTFNQKEGLQNNNVLSIFRDRQGNLWLGLDNGIDFIAQNSAIKHIVPFSGIGSGYTATIFNNQLYIGTSNGLYHVMLQPKSDLSFSKGSFTLVANTEGQTWSLAQINNQLLLGHHEGAFVVQNSIARQISSQNGFWNFIPVTGIFPVPHIITGNYKELTFFDYVNGNFIPKQTIPGFHESSRFVAIDKFENIWVSHPYHGVFRIYKNNKGEFQSSAYTDKNGLPSSLNNHVYKIRNEIVVATERGIYTYDHQKDIFEPSLFYKKILGDLGIRYLKEDPSGNIWFIHDKTLGVIDFTAKDPMIIYFPELRNRMVSGFEFIYPLNEENIFLGGEKGFYHINYKKYKQDVPRLQVQVRSIRMSNTRDSILFGGYFKPVNEQQLQNKNKIPEISHSWKTFRFVYSSALYGYQSNLEYSYRLKGFDESWSAWTVRTEKEYTNLPAGTYTFEVKVRSNYGNESVPATYTLTILPPWYQTVWAYLFYFFLAIMGFLALYKWQKNKFKQQHAKHNEEQKRLQYIHELEMKKAESELVALRNEKLEAEINFKNSEVASSAMHLVKKGELLTRIKSELNHIMKGLEDQTSVDEIKRVIKTLSEDDKADLEWENFTKHFDKVHVDFLVKLKEMHPNITNNELKLCAYLRMNLTTKEIAQFMNISVRGVEVNRYRLRKKLQLPTEISLFDYLIKI